MNDFTKLADFFKAIKAMSLDEYQVERLVLAYKTKFSMEYLQSFTEGFNAWLYNDSLYTVSRKGFGYSRLLGLDKSETYIIPSLISSKEELEEFYSKAGVEITDEIREKINKLGEFQLEISEVYFNSFVYEFKNGPVEASLSYFPDYEVEHRLALTVFETDIAALISNLCDPLSEEGFVSIPPHKAQNAEMDHHINLRTYLPEEAIWCCWHRKSAGQQNQYVVITENEYTSVTVVDRAISQTFVETLPLVLRSDHRLFHYLGDGIVDLSEYEDESFELREVGDHILYQAVRNDGSAVNLEIYRDQGMLDSYISAEISVEDPNAEVDAEEEDDTELDQEQ